MIKVLKRTVPILFIIIGSVICLNGIALFFVSNLNLGNFLTVIFGASIVLTVVFFKKLTLVLKIFIIAALGIAVAFSSFLIIYGKSNNTTYKEDAVIVLGAAVHGKTPSLSLKRRLDAAAEYYNKNPNALIVVSGGKGQGEDITEAEAMQIYLTEKGVPQQSIIKETAATSTYENFAFSKEILDKHFNKDYVVAFVTNEFHIFRAGLCAKSAGFDGITHMHANTNLSYVISGVLRECLAVVKYAVFKS